MKAKKTHQMLKFSCFLVGLTLLIVGVTFARTATSPAHSPRISASEKGFLSASPLFMYNRQTSSICTLEYETTDRSPQNNHTFDTAAPLANYTGQALTEGHGSPTQTIEAELWTDYYRLDNAQRVYQYTVKAVPDKTINYDLGIIVYDKNRTPIITDSNPFDGNSAVVKLRAIDYGPYFFRVFQRSEQCKGSTYSLLVSTDAPAPIPAENIEFLGHTGGTTHAVFVAGDYAYIGEGPKLTVLDITDPAAPTMVGETTLLPAIVQDIHVSGDYAYVVTGYDGGLQVVDVSDPSIPTVVGSYDVHSANDVDVSGDIAYVAAGGLLVMDVGDPFNPVEIGFYDTKWASDVTVSGDTAYVAAWYDGLRVMDVRDPTNPIEVGVCDTLGAVRSVAVRGDIAYVASYWGGLRVVDVSDPANPTEVGSLERRSTAWGREDLVINGDIVYVADAYEGLWIVDVSDPTNPIELGSCSASGYAESVAVQDNAAYVASRTGGLRVMDVSDPTHPNKIGFRDASGRVSSVYISGTTAYVVGEYDNLRVIDVNDATNPTELGSYDISAHVSDVVVSGKTAYLAAGGDDGLQVVDVSDPANPIEVGDYETPGGAQDVAIRGDIAYIADGEDGGLRVVDVSNPITPTELGFYDTPGDAQSVTVSEGTAYVADGDAGLRMVDVSDPIHPTEVGHYNTSEVRDVAVSGDIAYVATGALHVVDVSNPATPIEIGVYDTEKDTSGIIISGTLAYVGADGLRVVNVSDPRTPIEIGFYDKVASDIAVNGSVVYVANGDGGLIILRYDYMTSISGQVYDDSGAPLSGVTISAGTGLATTTDADGFYTLPDLTPGAYKLTPTKPGCRFSPASHTVVVPPDAQNQNFEGRCDFDVSGHVYTLGGDPVAGVTIATETGCTVTTNSAGAYTIPELISGTYTLTPRQSNWAFIPATRTVRVPPDATQQDFTLLHPSVSTTLRLSGTINLPNMLMYVDTQGLTTTITFPVGAVTQATIIVLTPTLAQEAPDLAFAGHAFDLVAYQSGERQPDFTFRKPVTVSIHYSERDIQRVMDERQLTLRTLDEGTWRDAVCASRGMTYTRDMESNALHTPICHLSRFGLFGPSYQYLYLPLVLKTWPPLPPTPEPTSTPEPIIPEICMLEYETVDKSPQDNHSFSHAAALANYTGQALTEGTGYPTQTVPSQLWTDYYRMDNAQLYYRYIVKAVPDRTINYDLGIIVYDKYYRPIITDSNPFDGNSAVVTLQVSDYGPYFFKVFQCSNQCKGSTYSLLLSAAAPTATPTPTPGAGPTSTPKPTPTLGPTPAPPTTCMLEYETSDRPPLDNHSFDTAAVLANYRGQALTEGTGYPTQTVPSQLWTDFYRLDNAQLHYRYNIKAVPHRTINYDLGIIVYDQNRTPIIIDSTPFDGNSAVVTLHAAQTGPYYVQVFQRSEQCKGSTYSLLLSAATPTATPQLTDTPSPSMPPSWP